MRFVAAIISLVIALGLIGVGVGQRTIFAPADRVTSAVELEAGAPIVVIDGETLNVRDGRQRIEVHGTGEEQIFAAYGRTADVLAWVNGTNYSEIVFDEESGRLNENFVEGEAAEAPFAAGSDLWLGEYQRAGSLEFTLNVPRDISLLIMSDGVAPVPAELSVTWPVDSRVPWSGPMIAVGVLFLLLGLGLYLWALSHLRKARGPRRKQSPPPKQPKLPRPPRYSVRKAIKAVRKPSPPQTGRGRRSAKRVAVSLPILLTGSLLLGACSSPSAELSTTTAAPTDAPVEESETAQPPAVTVPQLESIMARIETVAAQADETLDPALAESRFTGPALEMRKSNYTIRTADAAIAAQPPIHGDPIQLMLPQQTDSWPRTVFVIVQEPAVEEEPAQEEPTEEEPAQEEPAQEEPAPGEPNGDEPAAEQDAEEPAEPSIIPTALMLVQETPRENYKVAYAVPLRSQMELPAVAAATVGAVRLSPDTKLLTLSPAEVATAYADILVNGSDSAYADRFDLENDTLLPQVGKEKKAERAGSINIGSLSFAGAPGIGDNYALMSNESGAYLTMNLAETETAKPTEADAELSPSGLVKALSGIEKTTKGVESTYRYQLLFYVPPAASDEKIVLLGYEQSIVSAKEVE